LRGKGEGNRLRMGAVLKKGLSTPEKKKPPAQRGEKEDRRTSLKKKNCQGRGKNKEIKGGGVGGRVRREEESAKSWGGFHSHQKKK